MASKKYTNEDLYALVAIVLHFPKGGHGGEPFWNSMITIYGTTLLQGRKPGALRDRWRKIAKEVCFATGYNKIIVSHRFGSV